MALPTRARRLRRLIGVAVGMGAGVLAAYLVATALLPVRPRGVPGEPARPDLAAPIPAVIERGPGQASGTMDTGPVRLSVDPGAVLGIRIEERLFGQNLPVWTEPYWDDPEFLRLAREAAPTLLRFPGGRIGDALLWTRDDSRRWYTDPDGAGPLSGYLTPALLERFLALARKLKATPLLQVNVRVRDAAAAADLVQAARALLGQGDAIWEIGNEVAAFMTPQEYAQEFRRYANAMRLADPSARFLASGVFAPELAEWRGRILELIRPDFLAEHVYTLNQSGPMLDGSLYAADALGRPVREGSWQKLQFGWTRLHLDPVQAPLFGIHLFSFGFSGEETVHLGAARAFDPTGAPRTIGQPRILPELKAHLYLLDGRSAWHQSPDVQLLPGKNELAVDLPAKTPSPIREVGLELRAERDSPPPVVLQWLALAGGGPAENLLSDRARTALTARLYLYGLKGAETERPLRVGANVLRLPLAGATGGIGEIGLEMLSRAAVAGAVRPARVYLEKGERRLELIGPSTFAAVIAEPQSSGPRLDREELAWSFELRGGKQLDGLGKARLLRRGPGLESVDLAQYDELVGELFVVEAGEPAYGFAPVLGQLEARVQGGAIALQIQGTGPARLAGRPLLDPAGRVRLEAELVVDSQSPTALIEGQPVVSARVAVARMADLLFSLPAAANGPLEVPVFIDREGPDRQRFLLAQESWRDQLREASDAASRSAGRPRLAITEYGAYAADPPAHAGGTAAALLDAALLLHLARSGTPLAAGFDLLDTTPYGLIQVETQDGKTRFHTTQRYELFRLLSRLRGELVVLAGLPRDLEGLAAIEPGLLSVVLLNRGSRARAIDLAVPSNAQPPRVRTVGGSAEGTVEKILPDGRFTLPAESCSVLQFDLR